jgi:hypothetical protein
MKFKDLITGEQTSEVPRLLPGFFGRDRVNKADFMACGGHHVTAGEPGGPHHLSA